MAIKLTIVHYDLFAGIGGFSLALDNVYGKENTKHIFVEIDPFCQAVLRKHWPEGKFWGDIREFIAHAERKGWRERHFAQERQITRQNYTTILTGGFPCQPFSQAGQRRGTEDNRYLWPEMFRAIQLIKPDWVIAENVYGLLTWNEGMVFEQVCFDLENEGYEVQAFVLPAVAVNAPHRRDRVWIVGYAEYDGFNAAENKESSAQRGNSNEERQKENEQSTRPVMARSIASNSRNGMETEIQNARPSWEENWVEVATRLCRVDDGLSAWVDGVAYSPARHRKERLKMLGNAIVPQVAEVIFRGILTFTR